MQLSFQQSMNQFFSLLFMFGLYFLITRVSLIFGGYEIEEPKKGLQVLFGHAMGFILTYGLMNNSALSLK